MGNVRVAVGIEVIFPSWAFAPVFAEIPAPSSPTRTSDPQSGGRRLTLFAALVSQVEFAQLLGNSNADLRAAPSYARRAIYIFCSQRRRPFYTLDLLISQSLNNVLQSHLLRLEASGQSPKSDIALVRRAGKKIVRKPLNDGQKLGSADLIEMTVACEVCHHCHYFPKTFLNVSNFLFFNFFIKEVAIVASARKLRKIRRFLLPPPLATTGKFATNLFIPTTISPTTRSFRP